MAQVTYQITLSVDGNHAVSVSGDDPVAVNDGLAWARGMCLKLKERSATGSSQARSSETTQTHHHERRPLDTEQPPSCAIKNVPMIKMHGRKGEFWSCHEQLGDGTWCPYRHPRNRCRPTLP